MAPWTKGIVLTEHDIVELLKFYSKAGVRSQLYGWTLLDTFSEISVILTELHMESDVSYIK